MFESLKDINDLIIVINFSFPQSIKASFKDKTETHKNIKLLIFKG